jgi:Family of unknown function (DUF5685)
MFGLLQKRSCSCENDAKTMMAKSQYRLHYCGTCKTIGSNYGQSARLFLNFDTVFLSELLSNLAQAQPELWDASYQSKSCFALPQGKTEQPFALQYSAAVNVFMAELKLNDRITDQKSLFAATIRRALNRNFQKAAAELKALGTDTDTIYSLEKTQLAVERSFFAADTAPETILGHFAAPTAEMTALVFEAAAKHLPQGETPILKQKLRAFGSSFGKLVYVLDALEDFEKDKQNKEFNALRAALHSDTLSIAQRIVATNYLRQAEQEMTLALYDLPLAEAVKTEFAARISANLTLRLHHAARPYLSLKQSLAERLKTEWQHRTKTAQTLANQAFTNVLERAMPPVAGVHYAAFGAVAFFIPQIANTFNHNNKINWSFAALGLAAWATVKAAIGLGKQAKKSCNSPDNLQNLRSAKDCCDGASACDTSGGNEACCTGLCGCCCAACEGADCCSNCCSCCADSNGWKKDDWIFGLIVIAVLALLLGIAYLILVLAK